MMGPRGKALRANSSSVLIAVFSTWILVSAPQQVSGEVAPIHTSAVVKSYVQLPCDISPATKDDKTILVLWYKEGSGESPIFSLDLRGKAQEGPQHFPPEDIRSRSIFQADKKPAHLLIEDVRDEDQGVYRCRVDFKRAPTRNSVVSLSVIVPPKDPIILGEKGLELSSVVGPYNEGSTLFLSCEVVGGRPPPRVTWWRETILLDETYEVTSLGIVRNDLVVNALSRHDFNAVFMCQASNNNFTDPVSTSITVDMNLKPLEVRIINEEKPISSNRRRQFTCETVGSRPSPLVSWWKGSKRMKRTEESLSRDSNVTKSTMTFNPTSDDHGKILICRAENPAIPGSSIEDRRRLNVLYIPSLHLKLRASTEEDNIQEGDEVSLECTVHSNPSVTEVEWKFQGKPLLMNESFGGLMTNQSLVIPRVSKSNSGSYTCLANNQEGEGESNAVVIRIKHPPVCKTVAMTLRVARNKEVKLQCDVEAYPQEVNFKWEFNNVTDFLDSRRVVITSERTSSVLVYNPQSERDFGTFSCSGTNVMGTQPTPCIFILVPAGPPDSVRNCSIINQTISSLTVTCQSGYDGGLQQTFICEIVDSRTKEILTVLTSNYPTFHITNLPANSIFILSVYAFNSGGRSDSSIVMGFTLKAVSKDSVSDEWPSTVSTVIIGGVIALGLLGMLAVIAIRIRLQRSHRKKCKFKQRDRSHIPLQFYGEDSGNIEEKSPDLIPNSNDQEFPSVKVRCLQPKWAFSKDSAQKSTESEIGGGGGGGDTFPEHRCQNRKIMPMCQQIVYTVSENESHGSQ